MIGIYKITNPKGRIYIGQSFNIKKRWIAYKTSLGKSQPQLYNSFKKYGFDKHKFEVVIECDKEQLNDLERYYQELYSCLGKGGMNCTLVNDSQRTGEHSQETKEKIRQKAIGRVPSKECLEKRRIAMTGKKMPREGVLKRIKARHGWKHTEEAKQKLRDFANTPEEKLKKHLRSIGHPVSKETRLKISQKKIGVKMSESCKKRMSESSKKSRIVINIDNGVFYNSIKNAADSIGINRYSLCDMLRDRRKNTTLIRYAN